MTSLIRTIALNLREKRDELELTQEELATKCGMYRQSIGKIESGEVDIRVSTLERIANALGTEVIMFLEERK